MLVEQAVGQYESHLKDGNDISIVPGSDSPYRLFAEKIRYPDVAIVSYDFSDSKTIDVDAALDQRTMLHECDQLDGGSVLPGLTPSIGRWFANAA